VSPANNAAPETVDASGPAGATQGNTIGPRGIVARLAGPPQPRYSICTMLNDWAQYEVCRSSFLANGFEPSLAEFLVVDNSRENQADAYQALNEFLLVAQGDILIVCHQDVILLDDGRAELESRLRDLEERDPRWAVAGNAGFAETGFPAFCLSDSYNDLNICGQAFPVRVQTLDENFLVIRRLANLAVSADLTGFHHYGPDLCLVAQALGWSTWVIDFFVRHQCKTGPLPPAYHRSAQAFREKYSRLKRSRRVFLATGAHDFLTPSPVRRWLGPLSLLLAKVLRRLPRNRDAWSRAGHPNEPRYAAAVTRYKAKRP